MWLNPTNTSKVSVSNHRCITTIHPQVQLWLHTHRVVQLDDVPLVGHGDRQGRSGRCGGIEGLVVAWQAEVRPGAYAQEGPAIKGHAHHQHVRGAASLQGGNDVASIGVVLISKEAVSGPVRCMWSHR